MRTFLRNLSAVICVGGLSFLIWIGNEWRNEGPVEASRSAPKSYPTIDGQPISTDQFDYSSVATSQQPLQPQTASPPSSHSDYRDASALRQQSRMMANLDAAELHDRIGGTLRFPPEQAVDEYAIHLRSVCQRMDEKIVKVSNVVEFMVEYCYERGRTVTRLEMVRGLDEGTLGVEDQITLDEFAAAAVVLLTNGR